MAIALFLSSTAVIYLQIALMRLLDYVYYGTFTSMVIGIALIGFGAGGTFLALNRRRIEQNTASWMAGLAGIALFGTIGSVLALNSIPLNLAYLFYDIREILRFVIVILLLIPPFLGSGALIGLVLIRGQSRRGLLYGLNFLGSGIGGLAGWGAMAVISPTAMPIAAVIPLALTLFVLASGLKGRRRIGSIVLAAVGLLTFFVGPTSNRIDQYKDLASMQTLEAQGDAEALAGANSSFGRLEAYSSPLFHYYRFAGLGTPLALPEQIAIYRDGNLIGAPFTVDPPNLSEYSLSGIPFGISTPRRVLLIGDIGLSEVDAALAAGTKEVILLLPDQDLFDFLSEDLEFVSRRVFDRPELQVVVTDYRRYLLTHSNSFDLILLSSAASTSASAGGSLSATEDYLLTVEAMKAAIEALRPDGVLTASIGIQTPLRSNLKWLTTLYAALRSAGMESPENHIFQARDYLTAVTMAFRSSIDQGTRESLQYICETRRLDIEYIPGVGEAPPDYYRFVLPGPPDSGDSWLRHSNRILAADRRDELVKSWIFDIRPATDDRPFFNSFFRWHSLGIFMENYGRYWFRRTDLGSLVLWATLIAVSVISFLLVLFPHIARRARIRTGFLAYFPAVGFAYLTLEIIMIRRVSLYLGNPHTAVPVVLASLLAFSGLGSAVQSRLRRSLLWKTSVALVVTTAAFFTFVVPTTAILKLTAALSDFGDLFPYLFVIAATGIPGFFMGWFFAPALDRLETIEPESMPLAWAMNGFASVIASPLAVLLAIGLGFAATGGVAVAAYLASWTVAARYSYR